MPIVDDAGTQVERPKVARSLRSAPRPSRNNGGHSARSMNSARDTLHVCQPFGRTNAVVRGTAFGVSRPPGNPILAHECSLPDGGLSTASPVGT